MTGGGGRNVDDDSGPESRNADPSDYCRPERRLYKHCGRSETFKRIRALCLPRVLVCAYTFIRILYRIPRARLRPPSISVYTAAILSTIRTAVSLSLSLSQGSHSLFFFLFSSAHPRPPANGLCAYVSCAVSVQMPNNRLSARVALYFW